MEALLDLDRWQTIIVSSGSWAPIIYVVMIVFALALTPVPVTILVLFGGKFFGVVDGIFWSLLGLVLGAGLCFSIGRFFGRPILVKIFSEKKVREAEESIGEEHLIFSVFLFHLISVPVDIPDYLMGITRIKARHFMAAVLFGDIPFVVMLSYFGSTSTDAVGLLIPAVIAGVTSFFGMLTYEAFRVQNKKRRV